MNSLRTTYPSSTQQRARDLTPVEIAWLTQWASADRDNRSVGWNMDDVIRLIIVRRAVQAGFYNNGGPAMNVALDFGKEW